MKNIKKNKFLFALVLVCSLLQTACLGDQDKPSHSASSDKGISWFAGSMESALVEAKEKKNPLFVYWGAKWCPPCNVIKETVFKDLEFITSTKKYISVYLDGDDESAQTWGEKLNASGYPTLMILSSEGKEVVRLNNEMTSKEFAESMDAIYENLSPIDQLIAKIKNQKPEDVSLAAWRLVSNYSWAQAKKIENGLEWDRVYEEMYLLIPKKFKAEKRKLYLNSVLALLSKEAKSKKEKKDLDKETPLEDKMHTVQRLMEILSKDSLVAENAKFFSYYAGRLVKGLFVLSIEKSEKQLVDFITLYKKSLKKLRFSKELGRYERLITLYPLIAFNNLESKKFLLSEDEKAMIKREVVEGFKKVKTDYQKVFITSTGGYLLGEAGFVELAKKYLLEDIEKSKTPYYSMSGLARLAKKSKNNNEALRWYKKAAEATKGAATSLQWGSGYVLQMLELAPKNKETIVAELKTFFSKNLTEPDSFMGRSKFRLKRISTKVNSWAKEMKVESNIKEIKGNWQKKCLEKSKTKTEFYKKSCLEFFNSLAV